MARLFKRCECPKRRQSRCAHKWYAWIPKPGGGTKKQTTDCTDENAAHARAAELERESLDPDRAAAAKATLRDALELLIRSAAGKAKAGKGSRETVRFYQKKAGVLLDGLAEVLGRSPKASIFLREVKAGLVDDYIALRREEVTDSAIAKELTTWRSGCRLAKRRGWFPQDIEQVFPVGFGDGYTPRKRWLSPDELVRLYEAMVRPAGIRTPRLEPKRLAELRARRAAGEGAADLARAFALSVPSVHRLTSPKRVDPAPGPARGHELFAVVAFAVASGAEWSAIWRARREDIAPDLLEVLVRGSKNVNRVDRSVPIALPHFAFLLGFARDHGDGENGFLFSGTHASSFRHRLAEACKRAGIPHVAPTDLRRTHGKWLRLAGVAPGAIAPSLGHADARMVERVYGKASAKELAHVQRAQIAITGGILMGGDTRETQQKGAPPATASAEIPPENSCPGTESNRRHGDFQSSPTSQERSVDLPNSPTQWDANGQRSSAERTAPPEAVSSREDAHIPPSRGPAKVRTPKGMVGVRLEDEHGRVIARTDVTPGEPAEDVEARLRLAVGQKGGLR